MENVEGVSSVPQPPEFRYDPVRHELVTEGMTKEQIEALYEAWQGLTREERRNIRHSALRSNT